MNKNILKLKDRTPLQKLILLYIDEYPKGLMLTYRGCITTCGDLAKELGTTRKVMLDEFEILIDARDITSVVKDLGRTTNFTDKFKEMISD